jgi:5-formyltetrahydrofolate cyclo-ligase
MSRDYPEGYVERKVKAELRKRMRALRNTTPASICAKRSEAIVAALLDEPAVQNAGVIALFYPMEEKHEVDLRPLDAALRARGARVAYPSVDPDTREMVFREAPLDALEEQGLGFAEPPADAPAIAVGELAVVICPALGVSPNGHRLGYGAGFYDRALAAHPEAFAIAVAYDFQLLVELPTTEGDIACGAVITEKRRFPAR